MRVMITGSNGQVGSLLKEKLRDKCELLAVGREELDITDESAVRKVVNKFRPQYIINAAAHTAVDRAENERDLAFAINCDGPAHLARAAKAVGAAILHISTDYVFDGEYEFSYTETMPVSPHGIYGKSKLAGEIAIAENTDEHIILRTAWVFGENGNNFVKTMLRLGKDRDALSVVGDQFGGPTYAGDIANALITMVESIESGKEPFWGTYHFSGVPHVSWFEFAEAIFNEAMNSLLIQKVPVLTDIQTSAYPTPARRPKNSRLDCSKIKKHFDIDPSDWQYALKNISNYK
ncbi:dTDP-4-dehydrorhamnose reductase [Rahnella aceris]|jgi:dTDP-4-dehydrorhamnose reductase|uniref:dTDP-4-dehydrorhamnose reductase n=1 Tax=Rahnella sp. (strain Y9602) TaxID=2703885 RepID=UPI0019061132|nr:dTDP-4-dehydrorhamnose reductase [Rahnella aceris]QQN35624.1 dTDP-4-dehydrorhamnose reductase [Rahnella aceris]